MQKLRMARQQTDERHHGRVRFTTACWNSANLQRHSKSRLVATRLARKAARDSASGTLIAEI